MKRIFRQMATTLALACICLAANGQVKGSATRKQTLKVGDMPCVLQNNGKLLAKKGIESIAQSDVTAITVQKDTMYLSVKENVVTRLDKDPSNYQAKTKAPVKKKATPTKKNASRKGVALKRTN